METVTFTQARVYVGTYAKYNNNSLFGAWLNLSDYSDKEEFYKACRELHKDEDDPQFMFQDWDNVPRGLISEDGISDNFFFLRETVSAFSNTEQKAFIVWCIYKGYNLGKVDAEKLIQAFRSEYVGEYKDEESFAYQYVEKKYVLSEFAKTYFDYERLAVDLFINDYWMEGSSVFRIC